MEQPSTLSDPSEALRQLVSSPQGLDFLRELFLDRCQILQPLMQATHADMAYMNGRQSIGLELLAPFLTVFPNFLTLLMKESPDEPL